MLGPDYLDQAGDMVAGVYSDIETEMLEHLCRVLLDQDATQLGQRGSTALNLLAQTQGPYLMGIIRSHGGEVSDAIARTVEAAVERGDREDAERLGNDEHLQAAMRTQPRQVSMTAQGIAEQLARDNVDMVSGALRLWNGAVAEAVTKVNTGSATAERAIHQAVRRMMREGITTVTYRDPTTGRQTVTNRVDVAIRRHVRTQIAQDGMRRTLDICGSSGVQLVEVSSHGGARPSHARWQGRVYSLNGDVEIDGVRYRDFYAATGYGKVDGLGGANCRHSFGPWRPGTPRMYEPEPQHPSGLDNDEIYRLTQGQRRRERDIRQTKRELAGAQLIADKDASLANVAEVERLKSRLSDQQAAMRRYIEEANAKGRAPVLQRSPNREWAGDMPRIRKTDASRRTMREFMDSDGVTRVLKSRGISKSAAQSALSAEMKRRGIPSTSFKYLSRSTQQAVLKDALPSATPVKNGHRQFRKIAGEHTASQDLVAVNPGYAESRAARDFKYTHNCQRCVPAYEMRRRGYDVVAKPRETDGDGKPSTTDRVSSGWMGIFKGAQFERCNGSGRAKCDSLMKQWGDGARAEVYVAWPRKLGGGAHVFVAENRGGKVVYVDPQSGREDASGYFKNAQKGRTMIARIDSLDPSDLIDGCCTSRKGAAS